jgi:hypothetical protein
MLITSEKTYESGDKVTCIIASNTYLERGKEYTIERCVIEYGETLIYLEEQPGYQFNVARFISTQEIRDSKLNNILDNEKN